MPRTIPHRELRNNSSKILEEVKNGATIEITNHGEVVAVLSPPPAKTAYERLLAEGKIQLRDRGKLFSDLPPPVMTERDALEVLDEMRAD